MSTRDRYSTWSGNLAGLVLLICSITMASMYLGKESAVKSLQSLWTDFYKTVNPGWIRLTSDEMTEAVTSGNDEWNRMIMQATLTRWRLRGTAPEAFNGLMRNYQKGLWMIPETDVWTELLRQLDSRWREERQLSRGRGTDVSSSRPYFSVAAPEKILIVFPEQSRTSDLGTMPSFLIEVPPGGMPLPPALFWKTNQMKQKARRLFCLVTEQACPDPARRRYMLTPDLSGQPEWMNPDAIPEPFILFGPNVESWRLVGGASGDSPDLR